MKTRIALALVPLLLCGSLLAGDAGNPSRASTLPLAEKSEACCAAEPKEKAVCCCEGKTAAEKAACPVRHRLGVGGKIAACCEEKPAVKDACCAAMDAAAFSKESLYQLEAVFTDDRGRRVTLGSLRGRPVVLAMFFASCNYACPLTVTNMQAIREKLPAAVREQTAFVLVSFDVVRDTPVVLSQYRAQRLLDDGWTLLHGDDSAVRELAALLGVKYKQEATGMFSHSNIVTVLSPGGEIAHQRIGLNGGLDETVAAVMAAK